MKECKHGVGEYDGRCWECEPLDRLDVKNMIEECADKLEDRLNIQHDLIVQLISRINRLEELAGIKS